MWVGATQSKGKRTETPIPIDHTAEDRASPSVHINVSLFGSKFQELILRKKNKRGDKLNPKESLDSLLQEDGQPKKSGCQFSIWL